MPNNTAGNTTTTTTRKEVQCPFRLMNILFSDQFAERFAETGNTASRELLDTGMAGNDQHFWKSVQAAFISPVPNAEFDEFMFKDDVVLSLQTDDIDPSKIVQHDWKKLRTIWKASNSEYKSALSRFTVSGTHENDFWNFCNGRLEAYYLHKLLSLRPNLVGFVEAELPPQAALASNMTGDEITTRFTASNKRKKSPTSDIFDNIKASQDTRAELSREKIRHMQLEDQRQQENQQWKKEREDLEREKAQLEKDNALMAQWEVVVVNIRQLKQELKAPDLDEDDKEDILQDIEGLKARKKNLAVRLGLCAEP